MASWYLLQHQQPMQDDQQARICVVAGVEYEHEDDHNYTSFTSDELDSLEEFDFGLTNDDGDEPASEDVLVQQLVFPYTEQEPQLSTDQLKHLDAMAMEVETARLKQMGVRLPPESVEGMNPKRLSTRYVITWRDKVLNGKRCWLRRARYVAREYAWLSPERQDLFSPASSNITNRLLPSVFLHWKMKHPEKQFVMGAIDIGDAFLTVEQKQPTIVSSGSETFALGRVLPGQRDGSQLWFESVSGFLNEKLGFEHCSAYPSLLHSPCGECLILLHVDDMLVVTEQHYFEGKLLPALNGRYKTSVHCMKQPGDTLDFLHRIHVLVDDATIHIQQNPRHFDKLFEVVGVQSTMNPKKVPCHEMMTEVDDTPLLQAEKASRYRSAVDILLYLSTDLVECSYTIRGLAQSMSAPTERSWTMMKHLCLYLLSVRELVGTDVVTRERAADDVRGVLRMLRESIGERSSHKTMVATKRSLQTLLLLSLVHSTDALSLTSPISFSVLEQLQLHGLSCWMVSIVILFFMFASLLIAMPPRHSMLEEPEPEDTSGSAAVSSSSPAPKYNKAAVYCFLCICLKRSLELIDEAEAEDDSAKTSALHAIYEVFMDLFCAFERDGISPASLQSMKDMHGALNVHDPDFKASDFMTMELDNGFTMSTPEPEIESLLPPDPPDDFFAEEMAPPFEPRSPEHMAMWMIQRLTEKLRFEMESGNPEGVLKHVERREIMVNLCRFCNERPEQRLEVWKMMQSLTDISSDEEADD
ncbi:unnamed protein product [Cladocopium goreaui]|uniref:Mitochondrial protein n=1 Tax=Cladocopium goreaui TaxID=2562237 RepID=A0A9P1DE07_9DINO|nr:unnamed protein product [Cladocopium goreaui]